MQHHLNTSSTQRFRGALTLTTGIICLLLSVGCFFVAFTTGS